MSEAVGRPALSAFSAENRELKTGTARLLKCGTTKVCARTLHVWRPLACLQAQTRVP